jgi:hypothetical protein
MTMLTGCLVNRGGATDVDAIGLWPPVLVRGFVADGFAAFHRDFNV